MLLLKVLDLYNRTSGTVSKIWHNVEGNYLSPYQTSVESSYLKGAEPIAIFFICKLTLFCMSYT